MARPQEIFKQAEKLGFGELHFKIDKDSQLFAIIAIHNTKQGPALGGTRCLSYNNTVDAIYDALRLAQGMTYKAAISRVAHGGGKAVIVRPNAVLDKESYFKSYAKFVNELGGTYITAVDSGTTPADMDIIAKHTSYVTSTTKIGNPAPFTTRGVLRGIEAALKIKLNKNSLEGLHIAIQGLGSVGSLLAEECHQRGAKLTITDIDTQLANQVAKKLGATLVPHEKIYNVHCDVFAPCALGGVLNAHTICHLHTPIIAGSANNQLSDTHAGHLLHRLGILYAPDYVINAGGLIQASGRYYQASDEEIMQKIDQIYDTAFTIYQRSLELKKATSDIADELALEMLAQEPLPWKK